MLFQIGLSLGLVPEAKSVHRIIVDALIKEVQYFWRHFLCASGTGSQRYARDNVHSWFRYCEEILTKQSLSILPVIARRCRQSNPLILSLGLGAQRYARDDGWVKVL